MSTWRVLVAVCAALALASCTEVVDGGVNQGIDGGGVGDPGGPGDGGNTPDAVDGGGADADAGVEEVADGDAVATPDGTGWPEPGPGDPGWPCSENDECNSGYCVEGPDGQVCTSTCFESCPPGWSCKPVGSGADVAFICIYLHVPYCAPCEDAGDCDHPLAPALGHECVTEEDGSGSFCQTICSGDGDCPPDASCVPVDLPGGGTKQLCVPTSGECECSGYATKTVASTTCSVANAAGVCEGTRFCAPEGLTACDAATPELELCNGQDDDCDGATDEDFETLGTACDSDDADECANGEWVCDADGGVICEGDGDGGVELCNDLDDDCDGETDEDYPDKGLACDGDDADACEDGVWACQGGGIVCDDDLTSQVEACSGVDDDCDGLTDGQDPDLATAAALPLCENQEGVCAGAKKAAAACVAGVWEPCEAADYAGWSPFYQDGVEIACDGLDNDCDGETDEDFSAVLPSGAIVNGVGAECGLGACAGGLTVCNMAGDGTVCSTAGQGGPETCNGQDDDCDGLTDLQDPDLPQEPCEKQLGVCAGAMKPTTLCVDGAWLPCSPVLYSAIDPAYEGDSEVSCDGVDNDCDGGTDEDFALTLVDGTEVVGPGAPCGQGACDGGTTACNAAQSGLYCTTGFLAGVEVCDGVDNDCDGLTDAEDPDLQPTLCDKQEGVCAGATRTVDMCVDGGWLPCDDALYLSLSPLYEAGTELSCDGEDNDCDGVDDDDFGVELPDGTLINGAGQPCGQGVCGGGVTVCNAAGDGLECPGVANAGPEICDGQDNDCDGATDGADADMALILCDNQLGICAGAMRPASRCVSGFWEACTAADYAAWSPSYESPIEQTCDGQDNDCDGLADDDFQTLAPDGSVVTGVGKSCGTGPCAGGATVCTADLTGIECSDSAPPGQEVCDGEDNDCDGFVDAADPDLMLVPCDNQQGVCAGAMRPSFLCAGGQWLPCNEIAYELHDEAYEHSFEKTCEGLDNDCDGVTDDDFTVTTSDGIEVSGVGTSCGSGSCAGGITVCNVADTGIECTTEELAEPEVCDGVDNDCDGVADGGDPDLIVVPCDKQEGVCAGAMRLPSDCVDSEWQPCSDAAFASHSALYQAGVEASCDNQDNDCDGNTDEDFSYTGLDGSVAVGIGIACGVGSCAGGVTFCNATQTGTICSTENNAEAEVCDGQDNDCDGQLDGADPDMALVACDNQEGVCEGAMRTPLLCVGGSWQPCPSEVYALHDPAYSLGAEFACDDLDNDCDGVADGDFTVLMPDGSFVSGSGVACGTGACSGGFTQCNGAGDGLTCSTLVNVGPEVCDGIDNDCDGLTDTEDFDMQPALCELQGGLCAGVTKPTSLCVGGAWLPCTDDIYLAWNATYDPGGETGCDGLDNDCDGVADDDFYMEAPDGSLIIGTGQPCGIGPCSGGVTECNGDFDGIECSTGVLATQETCDGIDNDCDGQTDATDPDLLLQLCDVQQGVCAGAQTSPGLCVGGAWQPCTTPEYVSHHPAYNAGSELACDGLDNDCDGPADEDFTWDDGNGMALNVGATCGAGACAGGVVECVTTFQASCSTTGGGGGGGGGVESCNNIDDDCDGVTDNGCDDDGDQYCDGDMDFEGAPSICIFGGGDCDDTDPDVKPGTDELCNGVDDDCDGSTDEDYVGCAGESCVGSGNAYVQTSGAYCGDGVCVTPNPTPCGLYACVGGGQNGDTCATSCSTQAECVDAAHCDTSTSTCEPDVPNGGPCTLGSQCASGYCNNGFCCDTGTCCTQPNDCPGVFSQAPTCDDATTCQGSRIDATCSNNQCGSGAPVADDSGCTAAIQAQDCSPNLPVYCNGTTNQSPPVCAENCVSDAECLAGYHCDVTCQLDKPDGGSCDEDSDCASGHCQNGFCCQSGDCCNVASQCPAIYSSSAVCSDPDNCQGTGGLAVCNGFICGTSAGANDSACTSAIVADDCGPYLSVGCNGQATQSPPVCPSSCNFDFECDPGAHCDGICIDDLPDGSSCDEASDCISGYCGNGICCSGGDCCNVAGQCPASYSSPAVCDFATTCQGSADKAACVGHVCTTLTNQPDDSACVPGLPSKDCGAYPDVVCAGGSAQTEPACATSCVNDTGCDANAHCAGGQCQPDKPDGDPCTGASQCQSGHCQNGYCCASGDCCATAGSCPGAYTVAPHCSDSASCQGQRRNAACTNNVCQLGPIVDDDSGCAGLVANECGLYASQLCTAAANQTAPTCPNSCASDADCDNGATCVGDVCQPLAGAGDPCQSQGECGNGLVCVDGVCCTSTCDGECRRCDLAGSEGTCTFIAAAQDPDEECGAISCAGYYWGFSGDECKERADVSAAQNACNGSGACYSQDLFCNLQPAGDTDLACDPDCQVPTSGTCSGTTPGSCTDLDAGTLTCGQGGCQVTIPKCINGSLNTCVVGEGVPETCNGFDDDCDGLVDAQDPDLLVNDLELCELQHGVCSGCTKPASLCQDGAWSVCTPDTYEACDSQYEQNVEQSCDGEDNDCDGSPDDDFINDVDNCGECGLQCQNPHGSTQCASGTCLPTCDPGWARCGLPEQGCTTPTNTLGNCGGCGNLCALNNAAESCGTGECLITACEDGFCDLNNDDSDGCEAPIGTPANCTDAVSIGTVRGDTGSDTVQITGSGNAWFKLKVAEAVSDAFDVEDLRVRLTLSVPAGMDYDLEATCNNCQTAPSGFSQTDGLGIDEQLTMKWDEKCVEVFGECTGVPTGSDSGRDILIRIYFVDGAVCQDWTLTAVGNTGSGSDTCAEK